MQSQRGTQRPRWGLTHRDITGRKAEKGRLRDREAKTGMEIETGVRDTHRGGGRIETYRKKHKDSNQDDDSLRDRNGTETDGNGFSEKRMAAKPSQPTGIWHRGRSPSPVPLGEA